MDWEEHKRYIIGSIVLYNSKYYICSKGHMSQESFLRKNWIEISSSFLEQYSSEEQNKKLSIFTEFNSPTKRKFDFEDTQNKKIKLEENKCALLDKIEKLNLNNESKEFILNKYHMSRTLMGSEFSKVNYWLNTVSNIPFGIYKNFSDESPIEFFEKVKKHLDEKIYGLENVKEEILEFLARKIRNPNSKGHILGLYGEKGCGKTKIAKVLAEALDMPFYQINFGGMSDSSILLGHSETYSGSRPGKIVELLIQSKCMNPVIFLDECDKISEHKKIEINGVLTHLLDEEQNNNFQDNYLATVPIDLSRAFFIISFNDMYKMDNIVSDRIHLIHVKNPSIADKIEICETKLLPEMIDNLNLKDTRIVISRELIEYIIVTKCKNESGVRYLKKIFEKIIHKINYKLFFLTTDEFIITKKYIDECIFTNNPETNDYLSMYI